MAARGSQGNFEQHCENAARSRCVRKVFAHRGEAQSVSGVGVVHASFFAPTGIVNASQFS